MAKPKTIVASGNQDITSVALDEVISVDADWKIDSILLDFSAAVSKTYAASVLHGRKVVEGLNDYLWFIATDFYPTKITLDEGFYTGTELAAHLKTKLDAAFSPATFTVDYDTTTPNVFTIVASAGNIKYIEFNLQGFKPFKQSIAGHLFGFTADTNFTGTIASDTEVPALDSKVEVFGATDSLQEIYSVDEVPMDVDQALQLECTTGGTDVAWTVTYEKRV
jgi:hypothetical protein